MGEKKSKVKELEEALERAKREAEEEAEREEELRNKPIFDAISAAFNVDGKQISFEYWEDPSDVIECYYDGMSFAIANAGSDDVYIIVSPTRLHNFSYEGDTISDERKIREYIDMVEKEAKKMRSVMERFSEYEKLLKEKSE